MWVNERLLKIFEAGDTSVIPDVHRDLVRRGYNDRKEIQSFSDLVGLVFQSVTCTDSSVTFVTIGGRELVLLRERDCCEDVRIEDINGSLKDLVMCRILHAEESGRPADESEITDMSGTWTFYHLRTEKGDVTIRFLGESNGYYSESVDLFEFIGSTSIRHRAKISADKYSSGD